MNEVEIRGRIRKFIIDNFLFGDESAAPSPDQQLVQSGLVDSTGILEIVSFLEQEYGIETPDDDLAAENFGSVSAIAGFVLRKKI